MRNVSSEFLHFQHEVSDLDTSIVSVLAKRTGAQLGQIRWYAPWRQYVLYPSPQTLFNGRCLADITSQLVAMMDDWSEQKGRKKLHGVGKFRVRAQKRCGCLARVEPSGEVRCGRWLGHSGPHRPMGSTETWDA